MSKACTQVKKGMRIIQLGWKDFQFEVRVEGLLFHWRCKWKKTKIVELISNTYKVQMRLIGMSLCFAAEKVATDMNRTWQVLCFSCPVQLELNAAAYPDYWHVLFHLFPVIATMRDLKRKDKLVEAAGDAYGKTLSLAVLDVCNDDSVKQCINGIKDRHVDVLSEWKSSLSWTMHCYTVPKWYWFQNLSIVFFVSFLLCCVVNNAGIGLVGPLESIPIEEMKKVFETNFFGVIRMIKEVMPDMKKRKGGHIIVVSSVMGLQG